ncbi:MAG: NAD(P)/FAD-dependent oxidoreductase [Burkholderiaceae bacterium]
MGSSATNSNQSQPVIVVVGGGAGGLELVTRLGDKLARHKRARVILIDQSPIHIWKPHLHEVAAGSLDIGLHRLEYAAQAMWHHFEFQLGRFIGLDRADQTLTVAAMPDMDGQPMLPRRTIRYDFLVIAVGSTINTFGIAGALEHAIALDSPNEAERFRQKLVAACLRANARAEQGQAARVSIAIIGAGATGVELSAELRNAAQVLFAYGIHGLDPRRDIRITLVEGADRILPGLSERISRSVTRLIEKLDIDIMTGERVTNVSAGGIDTASGKHVPADLVVWAAGIKAPDLLKNLDGLESNRINQLVVTDHLQTTLDSRIYALGDCAQCAWGTKNTSVPPRAQAAHQQASYLFRILRDRLHGRESRPFRYRDFGSLVSIGTEQAVGSLMGGLIGGSMFIEGLIARLMYRSLYQMHMLALHGWIKTALDALSHSLRRATEPQVKLH